jgi:hypothetical protein
MASDCFHYWTYCLHYLAGKNELQQTHLELLRALLSNVRRTDAQECFYQVLEDDDTVNAVDEEWLIWMLEQGLVDPAFRENAPVKLASRKNFSGLVRRLLACDGVDPTSGQSYALRHACRKGCCETVQVLLEDGRAQIEAKDYECWESALTRGHRDVVRLLAVARPELKSLRFPYSPS